MVSEPKYRISVLMKCERLRRLDHRLVDREDFQRQAHRALETDALADVREIAHKGKTHISVNGGTVASSVQTSLIALMRAEIALLGVS